MRNKQFLLLFTRKSGTQTNRTLRPKFVPGHVGVISASDAVKDVGEEDEDFIHCSQSCPILVKAVLSLSGYQKKICDS